MQPEARRVGFAGLGAMGFGMTANLLKAGFHVSGFDVSPQALEKFAALGGQTCSSVGDASRRQAKFFVMVATPEQVDSLVFESNGLCASLPKSATICLFSTLPPAYIVALEVRLQASGRSDIRLLDCPVSGGVVGAKDGKLSIMLGGDDATIAGVRSELEAVSAPGRLFATGSLGSASTIKMLNQHLAGIHIVAAAETLSFAKALGLSSREAYKTLMASEGSSWIMGDRGFTMLNADWSPPKSAVDIFTKDLGIVNDAADSLSIPCPIASTALQAYTERAARGRGRDDDASVVCNYEDITGAKVAEPECNVSLLNSTSSQSVKCGPVVLVTRSDELATQFKQALASQQERDDHPNLQFLRHEEESLLSPLSQVANGGIVGVTSVVGQESWLQDLTSKFPNLQFFDYEVVLSDDEKTYQILFSAEDGKIATVLETNLAPAFSPVPVRGPVGSASKMYLAVRLGSLLHIAAATECYSLAVARGVSVQLVYDLIAGAAGSRAQFNRKFLQMINSDLACHSPLRSESLGKAMDDIKVLKLIAQRIKFPGRLLDAVHQIFKKVYHDKGGDVSTTALISYWSS